MSRRYPYTLYTCPCTESQTQSTPFDRIPEEEADEEDQTFNPHSHRANYSLYPLENLLFCNECHEIRCPRCYYEEALYYYCPSCLFEVSSNIVKTETNRCTRSCFQCPICIAPLAVQPIANSPDNRNQSAEPKSVREGPCMLACLYCSWSSLDVGLEFDRPVNISGQLSKLLNAASSQELPTPREPTSKSFSDSLRAQDTYAAAKAAPPDQFNQLANFYKSQIAETSPAGPLGLGFSSSFGVDSPSQLSRLLSTYGVGGLKKQRGRMPVMRETLSNPEGLRIDDPATDDAIIARMAETGWDDTASMEQQRNQHAQLRPLDRSYKFKQDLLPLATQLRSKRAKRCRACRHVLVKPDEKRQRNKYIMRIVALDYLPTTVLKPLDPTADLRTIRPHKTIQYQLTLRNPMFDAIKVTLATPQITPKTDAFGLQSKVTILCPQFSVGATRDDFEEALYDSDSVEDERRKAREGLEGPVAEAGKIWKKGRNWTTVVMEVVPGGRQIDARASQEVEDPWSSHIDGTVLEIPVFVRMEYETDGTALGHVADSQSSKGEGAGKVKREIAYWCVLGAGRINA